MGQATLRSKIWLNMYSIYLVSYIVLLTSNLGLNAKLQFPFLLISLLIFGPFLLWRTYSLNEFLVLTITLLMAVVVSVTSHTTVFIVLIVFIFGAQNVPVKAFVRKDLLARLTGVILVVVLSIVHIIPNLLMNRNGSSMRSSLGFDHPNTTGQMLLILMGELAFLYGRKHPYWVNITTLIALIVNFICLDSRSTELGLIGLILINGYFNLHHWPMKAHRWWSVLLMLVPWLTALVSLYLITHFSGNSFYWRLNNLLSNRLAYMNNVWNYYPITMWGQFIPTGSGFYQDLNRNVIDNSYFSILMRTGVVSFIIFLGYLSALIRRLRHQQNFQLLALMIIFCLVSLMESRLNYFQYNVGLLIWFMSDSVQKEDN